MSHPLRKALLELAAGGAAQREEGDQRRGQQKQGVVQQIDGRGSVSFRL
jgi:hypothetical protein